MDYSIIIPAFNKAGFTRHCLQTLRPTLAGAGEGEVIVIDNASSDETPQMLAEFDWIRVVRNERNTGFAAANNQGAQLARGEFLVLLNNDTAPGGGWLTALLKAARQANVGAVGARLLYPNGTIQHAGVTINAERYGTAGFTPVHWQIGQPAADPAVQEPAEYQIVTAACMVTPRNVYLDCGGLDERFWNGYEDVDYCLRLRARGLRVLYEPQAVLTHFESQSGPQRFRKVSWNIDALARRWNGKTQFDGNRRSIETGRVTRLVRMQRGVLQRTYIPVPEVTVLVHGAAQSSGAAYENALRANRTKIARLVFADAASAVQKARELMELRGERYVAFVDARADLRAGWLDELVRQVEFAPNTGAATYAPELPLGEDVAAFAADARCTLLRLEQFPQHLRLEPFATLDASVADLSVRALDVRVGTRGAAFPLGDLPPAANDSRFEDVHGMSVSAALASGREAIEAAFRRTPGRRAGLVSIVMLSWNAPQFTKMALESIREHTSGEYEVIIVDNGSGLETVEWLKTLDDSVHVIFNPENRGYAGGNNQAFAAAQGEYVVLLNNDVIVTAGWLEGLLHAFDRVPGLGVSAPRSNKIAGDQVVVDASYGDIAQMHEYAAARRQRYRDQGYMTDRAIGLCLCIDRRVIEEIGGIDERFGVGNFEDDDFCMRVRAAGYRIFVCDDVFIHHFGSQTFAANKVDWTATMRENWSKFAAKWNLPPKQENGGYVPAQAIRSGFDRARHFVALPAPDVPQAEAAREYEAVFFAAVRGDTDWEQTGAFARRYMRAFTAERPVLLAIAALGELDAFTIGERIKRLAAREGVDLDRAADIDVCDASDEESWAGSFCASRRFEVASLAERNPSALRRLLEEARK